MQFAVGSSWSKPIRYIINNQACNNYFKKLLTANCLLIFLAKTDLKKALTH